ncbi:histidine kinase [Flavobacterium branchiarum]|uniref:Sensor histidine kinase n=1 Tax=Flavobacterium branchiarum TaxID=1114870 RepID=A0ABV5FSH7_9FLAO|nr:histidine kinase [Flavobacterium branchiarum]MDN3672814.1 histidine kinase [Flavobacterium branchiarum]
MKKYLLWAPHLYIIIPLLLFLLFPLTFQIPFPKEFWILESFQLILYLIIYYTNYFLAVPKTFFKAKSTHFIIVICLLIIVSSSINYYAAVYFDIDAKMEYLMTSNKNTSIGFLKLNNFMFLCVTLFLIFISTTVKVNERLKKISNNRKQLEQEKLASELAFLKTQINPHFYFNVLHAIYSLTETNVEKAQEALHSLSLMMRYVIYETKHHSSMLSKEILFIEHYIKLMKLRIPQNTEIIFNKPEFIKDHPISSMILLPFIENAFKHGLTFSKQDQIIINIYQESKVLIFEVINPIAQIKAKDLEESNGIGLTNTKRRLDLLYSGFYELEIDNNQEKKEFRINLKLQLA